MQSASAGALASPQRWGGTRNRTGRSTSERRRACQASPTPAVPPPPVKKGTALTETGGSLRKGPQGRKARKEKEDGAAPPRLNGRPGMHTSLQPKFFACGSCGTRAKYANYLNGRCDDRSSRAPKPGVLGTPRWNVGLPIICTHHLLHDTSPRTAAKNAQIRRAPLAPVSGI